MALRFDSKDGARAWVWDELSARGLARFPFPPHGRIPNFAGAREAALRLFEQPPWRAARALKVNPDSPQRWVRLEALRRGIRVYVPTPRLAGGFNLLDPERIPKAHYGEAANRTTMARWAVPVPLTALPPFDAIVTGCAAVTPDGRRCGKGAGYSEVEFAILRELGFDPVPVATTVHDVQVVGVFPVESNDLPLSLICTPTRTLVVECPPPAPAGIEWHRVTEADLAAMPLLRELRDLQRARADTPRGGPSGRPVEAVR
jgi:5-formyltetrahydrofolate cyclo-ligase